ncbi:MAG: bifunctional glutamate N-acetyltransferase/amino-acid acetyltransferase ArgJ [Akkermansiaceae bacterium]|nr:bifunctional glutamate N-acetyltransferase/amino-acid acetyltransferase ArgJ [Armatimonadota bacterium]
MEIGKWSVVAGGVVAARGFQVAGVRCGIKRKRRDICLLVCEDGEATAAGVFTTNVVRAPCVDWSESRLAAKGTAKAIVVNAGNANAGNGYPGEHDNTQMAQWAANALRVPVDLILTASTGVIGTPLPMAIIASGITDAADHLGNSPEAATEAAEAILTTDTFTKEYAVRFPLPESGAVVTVGGMSKGSGMIAPNMATMLGFITTDVAMASDALRSALVAATAVSFNCLTVDGDTSTNDSCFLLASGAAGNVAIGDTDSADYQAFADALTHVCIHLAKEIARDGEGATKLVTVRVTGTATTEDARKVAKTIAESPLVKTALFGNDPNWGRILAAAGRAGVRFDPKKATAYLAGTCIFAHGTPTKFDAPAVSKAMAVKELTIHVDLGTGDAEARFYTCDFSYDYVRINAEYHT